MKRLLIAAVSLSLGLVGLSGGVQAQTNSGLVVMDDASGTDGIAGACNVSGPRRERLRSCRAADPDGGSTVADSPPETELVATDVAPNPAPAPEAASAPGTTEIGSRYRDRSGRG